MTSSSRRKLRTTVWSSARRAATGLFALLLAALGLSACHRAPRESLVTYFNGDFHLSLQYPGAWRTESAEQEGVWYRYFLGPVTGPARKPAVSATLLAGPLAGTVDEYAQAYLAGNVLAAHKDERRPGLAGKSYAFASQDGKQRFALLLLKEQQPPPGSSTSRVFGLYCQGDAEPFEQYRPLLESMAASLALERVEDYVPHRVPEHGLLLRLPPSWRHVRRLTAGGARIDHFTSPALGIEKNGETVHASLTVTVEPAPTGLAAYYQDVRQKLGPNFQVVTHAEWGDGYVDLMAVETPMSASRIRRFYRVSGQTGCSLAFEAREDVFQRASRWFDFIAETLRLGAQQVPGAR
jgi:hypothetical protein